MKVRVLTDRFKTKIAPITDCFYYVNWYIFFVRDPVDLVGVWLGHRYAGVLHPQDVQQGRTSLLTQADGNSNVPNSVADPDRDMGSGTGTFTPLDPETRSGMNLYRNRHGF
jgi:hypothetical protein